MCLLISAMRHLKTNAKPINEESTYSDLMCILQISYFVNFLNELNELLKNETILSASVDKHSVFTLADIVREPLN